MESSTFKAALEIIPNVPFPAGSMVKGLVGILALGMVRAFCPHNPSFIELTSRKYPKERKMHSSLPCKLSTISAQWQMRWERVHRMTQSLYNVGTI
jgi:hypothetical protein